MMTTAATTPCRADAKAWRTKSDRNRAARTVARGGPTDCPPTPCGTKNSGSKPCVGGVAEEEAYVGRVVGTDGECSPTPPVQASIRTGSLCGPKCAKGAPLRGMSCEDCRIFFASPPSSPIHVRQGESGGNPCAWAPNWRLGGAPHPATKILPGIPPYFSLAKNIWSCSLSL